MIEELALGVMPFRGSWAVERGLLTERVLRGHRYRRLFKDIYLLASAPADLAARSQGATLLVPGRGVLSGYSAAELLGARCAPADANAELTVPGGDLREQPGLPCTVTRLPTTRSQTLPACLPRPHCAPCGTCGAVATDGGGGGGDRCAGKGRAVRPGRGAPDPWPLPESALAASGARSDRPLQSPG